MTDIAIYIEGGGDTSQQKAALRQGFDGLLGKIKASAREKLVRLTLVCGGGRDATFEAFMNSVRTKADAISVLLVDSEGPIAPQSNDPDTNAAQRVAHLAARDNWAFGNVPPDRVHLMVQCMETWIVADPDALASFYGQGFARNSLPVRRNLEEEPKPDVHEKLARATRQTQKGEYAKIRHASQLLPKVSADRIAARCPRFATFTDWLEETIQAS